MGGYPQLAPLADRPRCKTFNPLQCGRGLNLFIGKWLNEEETLGAFKEHLHGDDYQDHAHQTFDS